MRVLRAENHRRMKWKNGAGETAEIVVFPEDAALDSFGWRISMANVGADGPFSAFEGIDRTLSVLEGEGIVLDIEGRDRLTLTRESLPYSFPADAPTGAFLVDGPIVDLNVMSRRGRFGHKVTRRRLDGALELPARTGTTLLFCQEGRATVENGDERTEIGRFDATVHAGGDALRLHGEGEFLIVEIEGEDRAA